MDTLFMNSANSKTSDPQGLLVNLSGKINFKEVTIILLYQILAFTLRGKYKKVIYNNNEFEISAPTWNKEFKLLDESFPAPDIQDYCEYIIKNIKE